MESITCDEAQARLGELMDKVCHGRIPILITQPNGNSVVMIGREDYKAMDDVALLPEASLRRDCDRPEEDEAWSGLQKDQ